jgi:phage tail-like protein
MSLIGISGGDYPLPAFHFQVAFAGQTMFDSSFQEVRGISSEIETEEVPEGGENRFTLRLPKAVKHPQLELKRGIASITSPLVLWCKDSLESGLNSKIVCLPVQVSLLDGDGIPVRNWLFADAWPVKWEVGDFNSTKNEVAIETIVLNYTWSNRLI